MNPCRLQDSFDLRHRSVTDTIYLIQIVVQTLNQQATGLQVTVSRNSDHSQWRRCKNMMAIQLRVPSYTASSRPLSVNKLSCELIVVLWV